MMHNRPAENAMNHAAYEAYLEELGSDDSAFRAAFREAFFHALLKTLAEEGESHAAGVWPGRA